MSKTPRSPASQRKLRISIVGAGRMGTALGVALRRAGHFIPVVVTRRASHASASAKAVGGAIPLTDRQLSNPSRASLVGFFESDVVLISTPDDVLSGVAANLGAILPAQSRKAVAVKRVALHTSGAVSSQVLAPLRKAGFAVGSMHPLVSVAHGPTSADLFRGVHFCVEGDLRAVRVARALIRDLRGQVFTIDPALKPLYHAAAAMASGQFLALIDVAIEMLAECGLSKRQAQQILLPLLRSSVENLETKTPSEALTGPLSRRDVSTVRKHLASMKTKKLSEAADSVFDVGCPSPETLTFKQRDKRCRRCYRKTVTRPAREYSVITT